MIDFKALGAKATAESGKDMTKAQAGGGGGEYEPPKAGFCLLRLVGYFEIGRQHGTFQGAPVIKDKVQLVFELSGPNHQPKELEDGTKIPHRITIEENYSLNEKAKFFKLFQRLNYKGEATHMVQLVGEAFKGKIIHREYKRKDGKPGVAVDLYDKASGTYTIDAPRTEVTDPDTGMPTGEVRVLNVPPAITVPKAFLWDFADKAMWDSIFIDGEYPERKNDKGEVTAPARSKNVIQNAIKSAVNFKGSPIYAVLAASGGNLDIPEPEKAAPAAAQDTPASDDDDVLNGI